MRDVLYVAHPVAPTDDEVQSIMEMHGQKGEVPSPARIDEAVRANVYRAMAWLSWLRRSFPETTFIAPWIAAILAGEDDSNPAQREAGLVDCCAVVERCDGIVLCGSRISSGMQREREHGRGRHQVNREPGGIAANPFKVYDLICEPPGNPLPYVGPMTMGFAAWAGPFCE